MRLGEAYNMGYIIGVIWGTMEKKIDATIIVF